MEFGKDHREFDCDSPFVEGGLNEAAKTPKSTGNNDISVIQENVGCCMTTSTCITQHEEKKNNEDGILRKLGRRSFEKKMEPPSGKMIHKTESFGSHLLINMDEVNSNTVTESFDKRGSILSRTSSNGLGNSFSLAEGDISDNIALRVQSPKQRTKSMSTEEGGPDADKGRNLHVEPSLPIYLKFQDVKHKVAAAKGMKSSNAEYILHGITGSVLPGEVLALMGPSGGGKTTLLNLLSGRVKLKTGTITYNDQPYTKFLKRRIGFVMQDDLLFSHLTVKETLTYAALLRLPLTLTRNQKKERAMNVINELGLERCQDTLIGGTFVKGVSGGERKRVCIGNEILLNPSLLFLDEPTSGLDSTSALRILQMLHIIAKAGKTVVTTIHQPSSRIFNKFDKLILLGRGSSLYFGKASESMTYFSSIGCAPLIAMNPAEFLIDLANGNTNDKSLPTELEDGRPSTVDVHEFLVEANQIRLAEMKKTKLLSYVQTDGENMLQGKGMTHLRESNATWCEQFSILFRRGLKERRHEYLSCLRVFQVVSTALIIGLLWWQSDTSSRRQFQDQAGLLFFISVFWTFFPLFTAVFTFPQERAILAKERSVEMYKLSAYFLARNTSDIPLDLLLPLAFLVIVYLMTGLKLTFTAFIQTMLTIFLSIVASQGLGLTIGAAFADVKKATTLASIVVMTFMLSGGFFIKKVPSNVSWIRYISFNYHSYRLLLKIQYGCPSRSGTSGNETCESQLIKELRLDSGVTEVGAMIVMIIGYRLLAYLFLRAMKFRTMI
ncbi:ABC transporter G family member 22-like [Pyrus ussuriensis x Pyrus communis]|uniref:ABC transporter G family member 22-like n=1 Tax=Pyrus ussuriensis x Pyrus communis TaxID=2448454 RepID=A0A5N5FL67_9ROSA|nr:ABC transporter G family member 22-like [Pyrus ussuriensis x Pyrus communis]